MYRFFFQNTKIRVHFLYTFSIEPKSVDEMGKNSISCDWIFLLKTLKKV